MWWIVWIVIMVVVPCLEGLHVAWELRAPMEEKISGSLLEDLGLNPTPARAAWRSFLTGQHHRPELLWSLYALMVWSERWTARAEAAPEIPRTR